MFHYSGVAQKKADEEIKERDEKCSELDLKLNRLHKRAKQRIQEVQKVCDSFLPLFILAVFLILPLLLLVLFLVG